MEANPWDVRPTFTDDSLKNVKNKEFSQNIKKKLVDNVLKLNSVSNVPINCRIKQNGHDKAVEDDTLESASSEFSLKSCSQNTLCARPVLNSKPVKKRKFAIQDIETEFHQVNETENFVIEAPSAKRQKNGLESDKIQIEKDILPINEKPLYVAPKPVLNNDVSFHPTDNYLKINIKKKCFSKGGSRRQRFLRNQLKKEKYNKKFGKSDSDHYGRDTGLSNASTNCFHCKKPGHWASKCPFKFMKPKDKTIVQEVIDLNEKAEFRILDTSQLKNQFPSPDLQDFIQCTPCVVDRILENPTIDSSVKLEIGNVMKELGVKSFRTGQELVVWRILHGQTTLVVLPTGAGKSLCYQVPALVYHKLRKPCVALIVSPLISLMQDQVADKNLNSYGAFINSSQTTKVKEEILQKAKNGEYAFLLMSPEALVESDWILRNNRLPPISFACIDEAHCLADWSHHFRPSYLRVCQILKQRLGVTTFLGLSATCTKSTIKNICHNLGIDDPQRILSGTTEEELISGMSGAGFIQPFDTPLPNNLQICVSVDSDREAAIAEMLMKPPFLELSSILIYVATRDQSERIARFLRTTLKDNVIKVGRKKLTWDAQPYHAGQTIGERNRTQKKFMSGKLRVVVATNAFGMGINKKDLQAVIHFALPKSFENYIQEIGRVGRSGQQSFCHAFIPSAMEADPIEANEIRRHVFTNSIDRNLVKRFVSKLFDTKSTLISIDPTEWSTTLDIHPESLGTLLAYLDLWKEERLITLLCPNHAVANINCQNGFKEMARVSEKCMAVAAYLGYLSEHERGFDPECCTKLSLNIPLLTSLYGWMPYLIKAELNTLNWDKAPGEAISHQTGVDITYEKWSWWVWIHNTSPSDEFMDNCLDYLMSRLNSVEQGSLRGVEQLTQVLQTVSAKSIHSVYYLNDADKAEVNFTKTKAIEASAKAHELICNYFMDDLKEENELEKLWPPALVDKQEQCARSTIRSFIHLYAHNLSEKINGRVIANVLHGIGSPRFPAIRWSKINRYWKAHLEIDWPTLKRWSTEEIINAGVI